MMQMDIFIVRLNIYGMWLFIWKYAETYLRPLKILLVEFFLGKIDNSF